MTVQPTIPAVPGLREQYAAALWPLTDWDGDVLNAEAAADAVLAVRDAEMERLRAELATARQGASERAALLDEARDALEEAGQAGAHGDDWPEIGPAIRALAADRDRLAARVLALADAVEAGAPWAANHDNIASRLRATVRGEGQ